MTPVLEIAARRALGAFTLDVALAAGNELVVLFGRSGAGKSLTLRAVAGLFQPAHGRIALGGRTLFDSASGVDLPPQARRVGYVPQSYALFPHLTAEQNIAYALHDQPPAQRAQRTAQLMELVALGDHAGRKPAQLSGGQQQRVALARALARRPEALLLDEPLAALDAPTRADLRRSLRALQQQLAIPILFVTHDLGEAYFMADRLAVLEGGRVIQADAPGEVLRRPASRRVAALMGVKNIFDACVLGSRADGLRARVGEVELTAPPLPAVRAASVCLCIRPERILLVRPERLGADRENLLQGCIVDEMSDGTTVVLRFRLSGARLRPDREYDLEIELPVYVYERLNLATQRDWSVSLKRDAMHVIEEPA